MDVGPLKINNLVIHPEREIEREKSDQNTECKSNLERVMD